jgi:MFS family permease
VATWSLGGLYLALAPAIVAQAFGLNGTSIGGAAIGLLAGAGAIIPAAARAVPARALAVAANLAMLTMLTGIAAALAAIEVRGIVLFLAASAVGGAGFGAGFSSWLRLLIPDVAPAERTRFYSAFYLVNYLAFGLPALVAGEVIGAVGLDTTVLAYGALAMTAAVAGLRNEISMGRLKRNAQREEARAIPMTRERSQSEWQASGSLSWAVPQE